MSISLPPSLPPPSLTFLPTNPNLIFLLLSFRDSCSNGWRLFIILSGYLQCSDVLRPYLVHFLQSTSNDPKREFHGTSVDYDDGYNVGDGDDYNSDDDGDDYDDGYNVGVGDDYNSDGDGGGDDDDYGDDNDFIVFLFLQKVLLQHAK